MIISYRLEVAMKLEKITISLPGEMVAEIKAAIAAGEYTNTSEAIREAIRQWRRSRIVIALNDDDLRRMVAEGRKSGDAVDDPTALSRLRAKYAAMAERAGGGSDR
jgi:antitoxin ParD1/3/4